MPRAPLSVPVFYDFASTLSYVAHRVVGRLARPLDESGIRFDWRPIDLTMLTGWRRGRPLDGPRRQQVVEIARALVGEARIPITWLDVRRVATIALTLGDTPAASSWRERVWTGIYEEGRDPADDREVYAWAREVGLDLPTIEARTDDLADATVRARAAGVAAVPTFLLGSWPMAGIQDDATMLAVLTRFASKTS